MRCLTKWDLVPTEKGEKGSLIKIRTHMTKLGLILRRQAEAVAVDLTFVSASLISL